MNKSVLSTVSSWFRPRAPLTQILSNLPLFAKLTMRQLKEVERIVHLRTYRTGEVIFNQGDAGVAMYVILGGQVRIVLPGVTAEENRHLATLEAGELFGEMGLLDSSPRSASAIAAMTVEAAAIARPDWMDLVHRHPDIGVSMLIPLSQMIAARLRTTNQPSSGRKK